MQQAPHGSAQAARAIWDWRSARSRGGADAAAHRRGGLIRAAVGAGAGALLWRLGHAHLAAVTWSIATVLGSLALASPGRAYAAVDRAVEKLASGVGVVVGWLVLVPVFYVVFVPFGLIARRGAADAMQRRYDPTATSYWRKRPPTEPSLDRQF